MDTNRNGNVKIDAEHNRWVRWIPIFIVFLAVVCGAISFKCCGNSISEDVENNKGAYVPLDKDSVGFVGKTNALLEYLLKFQDTTVKVNSVETLNKRYYALVFSAPYEIITDSTDMLVEDIRLVGINESYIKDEKWLEFYKNSSLESVLLDQKNDIAKKIFKISFRGTYIKSIKIIPTMFKVSLRNDVFKTAIVCRENSLFIGNEENPVYYLVSGETVLPIRRRDQIGNLCEIKLSNDGNFTDENGGTINYYDYYCSDFVKMKELNIKCGAGEKGLSLYIGVGENSNSDMVYLKTDGGTSVSYEVLYGQKILKHKGTAEIDSCLPYEYKDGMIIIVRDGLEKVGEFTLVSKNPSLILSSMFKTNKGVSSYDFPPKTADLFTRQVVYGLNSTLNNENCNEDTIRLSLDPLLAKEFEKDMKEYIKKYSGDNTQRNHWEMSMTVMDMATGEIIAAPFYSTIIENITSEDLKLVRKSPVLNRMYIGSTFKPLLALAAVQTNHSLLDLNTIGKVINDREKKKCAFFGAQLPYNEDNVWAGDSHWAGCDFTNFISSSNDVFPVALAALAMNGYGIEDNISNCTDMTRNMGVNGSIFKPYANNGIVLKSDDARSMGHYELLQMIDLLYHVHSYEDETINDTMGNDLWRFLPLKKNLTDENKLERNIGLMSITPDVTNMHYEQFHTGRAMRGELVPWVLGQGNNYWCPLKVAEAWTRMITKQPVRYTLVMSPDGRYIVEKPLVEQIVEKRREWGCEDTTVNTIWNKFLKKLEDAQSQGTLLNRMYDTVCELNRNMGHASDDDTSKLILFSKTGTPNNYKQNIVLRLNGEPYVVDLGMYTFSLMRNGEVKKAKNGEPAKGITCVIRIVCLKREPRNADNAQLQQNNVFESKDARNFFSDDYNRLKKFYEMTKIYY